MKYNHSKTFEKHLKDKIKKKRHSYFSEYTDVIKVGENRPFSKPNRDFVKTSQKRNLKEVYNIISNENRIFRGPKPKIQKSIENREVKTTLLNIVDTIVKQNDENSIEKIQPDDETFDLI